MLGLRRHHGLRGHSVHQEWQGVVWAHASHQHCGLADRAGDNIGGIRLRCGLVAGASLSTLSLTIPKYLSHHIYLYLYSNANWKRFQQSQQRPQKDKRKPVPARIPPRKVKLFGNSDCIFALHLTASLASSLFLPRFHCLTLSFTLSSELHTPLREGPSTAHYDIKIKIV